MSVESGRTLSHYRLVEKIEGGMGVVWKAEDTILGRTVAIKVLRPDAARDDERRRMFVDEARLASMLGHAHIVQVHELGRDGELDFIVMEYVEGKPLSRILHGRPLPPDKVANLGLQVAQAVARAHHKGLLHRDLKPANILVTSEGDVKVVDFGLATLFEHRDTTLASGLQSETVSLRGDPRKPDGLKLPEIAGTLPYMSPEQVRGETVDPRSDIFSLGTVLYEMTTGQRPFTAPTHGELAREIFKSQPIAPHELVERVPLDLERIVQKALAPRPGDRYQTMDDIAVDLRHLGRELESGSSPSYQDLKPTSKAGRLRRKRTWVAAGVAALLVAGTPAWLVLSRRGARSEALRLARTVLILPVQVHGQTEGGDYLGRAFSEAIAVNLVEAKQIAVLPVPEQMPPTTAGPLEPSRNALALGAGRVMVGSLNRSGGTLQVSLSLLDATNNRILWGMQSDAQQGDLPQLAATVAKGLSGQLGVPMSRQYEYFRYVTGSPAMASSATLQEAIGATRRHDVPAALSATKSLVDEYPNEPDAHVLRVVATTDALNAEFSPTNLSALKQEIAALERSDPNHPLVALERADLLTNQEDKHEAAIAQLNQVLSRDDLTPAFRAHALRTRGRAKYRGGNMSAGLADLEEAVRLDPANPWTFAYLSSILNQAGKFDEAAARSRQAMALDPFEISNQCELAYTLVSAGHREEGLEILARLCETHPTQTMFRYHAYALIKAGREEAALDMARKAEKMGENANDMYNLGCVWALAHRPSEALRLLQRSLELGFRSSSIAEDEDLASLRGDPRFAAIVAAAKRPHEETRP